MEELDYYFAINEASKKYKAETFGEELIDEDGEHFEVDVSGLPFAKYFAFIWMKNEEDIHYSSIYEFKDGTIDKFDIYHNIKKRLVPPFDDVMFDESRTSIEITGSVKKSDFNKDVVADIFHYVTTDEEVVGKLSTLSVLYEREPLPTKKQCDSSLLETYQYFQKFGDGRLRCIHRLLAITMDELEANIQTLLKIGFIDESENFEYVIKNNKAARIYNDNKLMKTINKEIKKHER